MNTLALEDIAEIVQGGRHGLSGNHFVPRGYPAYGAGGLNGYLETFEFEEEAVILSSIGARCGKCFFASGRWTSLANTQVIRPDPKLVDARFLWFQLNDEARWPRSGTGQPFIKPSDVKSHRVVLPPLSEQQRVAKQLKQTDRLRRMRRYGLELSDTLLPAAFLQLFGDPVRNMKGWNVELLEDISDPKSGIKAGPFGSSLKKELYSKSGIRIYGQEQVIAGDFSVGDYYISLDMFEAFRAYEVKPGDLLLSLVGTFGKVVVVPEGIERGIINPRLLKISPLRDRLDSVFLAHFIQHPFVQVSLGRMSHGGTMGILNAGLLKQVRVIVPPLRIQRQFAKLVAQQENLRAVQRESLRQSEHLFQTLLHRAFAGQLVRVARSRSVKRKPSVPAQKRTYSAGIFYRRATVEAYVINALRGDPYLGRTKLEKIDHLIEYHCGIDLERYPVRDAAGPDDYLSRIKLEHLADKRNWFSAHDKKDGSIVKYLPKRSFANAANKGAEAIGDKRVAVDNLLTLMRPLDTKRCEIIATLYAAWNDFLLVGRDPSDDEIVNDVLSNWRPEKQFIPERRWLRGLKWMRDNGLVPRGQGRPVLKANK